MSAIFGSLSVIIIYFIAKEAFGKNASPYFSAIFLSLETFWLGLSKIAQIQIFQVFFFLLSIYFLFRFLKNPKALFFGLTGFFFGYSLAVNWSVILTLPVIVFFLFTQPCRCSFYHAFLRMILFFLLITISYFSTFIFVFTKHSPLEFFHIQKQMLKIAKEIASESKINPYFAENPLSWIYYSTPKILYSEQIWTPKINGQNRGSIIWTGNLLIYYLSIPSLFYLFLKNYEKRNSISLLIPILFISYYLPFFFLPRGPAIHYSLPLVPLICLSVGYFLYKCQEERLFGKILFIFYLLFVALFFFYTISLPLGF